MENKPFRRRTFLWHDLCPLHGIHPAPGLLSPFAGGRSHKWVAQGGSAACDPTSTECPPEDLWLFPLQLLLISWPWRNMRGLSYLEDSIDWMVTTKFITFPELLQSSNSSFYVHNISFPHTKQQSYSRKGNLGWILPTFILSPGSAIVGKQQI